MRRPVTKLGFYNMTSGNSRSITSNQDGIHQDLNDIVNKHLTTEFKKPIAEHSKQAFDEITARVEQYLDSSVAPAIILDSCCGVGESTFHLAKQNPQSLVIGIDKSEHRLDKYEFHHQSQLDNFMLVRADLNDLWRLFSATDWPITEHYILYPNPWPKSKHIGRRWHGAPVFKYIPKLGAKLTVRSNWAIYIDEFAQALSLAGVEAATGQYSSDEAMTPFERKYWASGQQSFQLTAEFN